MSGPTVIDQMIVKLGLDPKDFTKGAKEAAAAVSNTEEKVTKSTDSMGSSIVKLGAKFLTATAVIAGLWKAAGIIDDVAERTRRLGVDAKNYDTAANRLRNFENAVQMMGGNAEDARKTVAGFQKSIFDLAYNGQVNDSLIMLGRLGVQFQDATGQARDFESVILDTADAIAKAQKDGMSRGQAFQYLQQSGFDQGTSNLILGGRAGVEAELNAQRERHQVNGEDVSKATDIRRASIGKDQTIENGKIAAMDAVGGIQQGINEMLANPSAAVEKFTGAISRAGTALENWGLKAQGTTRGLRNNNPGNIKAVGNQAKDRDGFRVFGTMEEGIQKANEQLGRYAAVGIDTMSKIVNTWAPKGDKNDVEAYLKDLEKQTGIGRDDKVGEGDRARVLAAMFRHESGVKAPSADDVADVLTYANDGPGDSPVPTPRAQSGGTVNKTDVQIDQINVNTQATDANAMSRDMDGAVKRKLMASHAETGVQ